MAKKSFNKTAMRPRRRFIRLWVPKIIRNDFWRKLIALFFALLIYIMVSSRIGTEKSIDNVPVKITIPSKLVNLNKQVRKVSVMVRGSKRQLNKLTASDIQISATVDENKFNPDSTYSLKLSTDNVTTPFGITVTRIEPEEFILNLEKVVDKKVSVKVNFDSKQLPQDYIVGKVTVFPAEVWIRGAASLVQNLDSVETAPVPLDNQTESFEYTTSIPKNSNYQVSPNKVTVNLVIDKYLASRTVKAVPIKILASSNDADKLDVEMLSTPHVDITLNGPRGKVMALNQNMLKAYIDISSLGEPGKYNVAVDCWLNLDGVKVTNIFPKEVAIKLSR